ncbi:vesicle-associated membrane protein 2-like [Oopsacas minuta]|uniref:Vesicle-associated membrane protein 2-like n=1 Tax=Oopsacas minuta TaxID=111878 RepID=A0AAV7JUI8_9METZ|nr:vesicle-associated membrane protein 2-like [Oopsacas minuta]
MGRNFYYSRDTRETDRIRDTQAKTTEVKSHLKTNIEKLLDRDQKLSDIDQRADQLEYGSRQFVYGATRLKRKMWWQNIKMWIILIIIIAVILIIIIAIIIIAVIAGNSGNK